MGIFVSVAQHCRTPSALQSGYRERGHFDVTDFCPLQGRNLSIKCITGYNLTSTHDTITCLENGSWSNTFPECTIVDCGDPGNVDNASREATSYTYQSIVNYTCHYGFTGEGSITCTANGNWTEKPLCTVIDCGNPGNIDNSKREGISYTYQSIVEYSCHVGFTGGGNISCSLSGSWTEKPRCTVINCGNPGNVDKAKREGTSYTYQSIVNYTCHDGFTGEGSITCTANGNWTEKPSCTASSSFGAGPLAGILIAIIVLIFIVVACVVFLIDGKYKALL
ncbi:E-selectin-like [Ptychodera flava]|uniref:E-selectin-like n=1 Tax=Ptychodera flava TaxID=63121 RepID=UPI00396A7CFC